jgi:hypothetical protein
LFSTVYTPSSDRPIWPSHRNLARKCMILRGMWVASENNRRVVRVTSVELYQK